jgi:hypothetical protein
MKWHIIYIFKKKVSDSWVRRGWLARSKNHSFIMKTESGRRISGRGITRSWRRLANGGREHK